MLEGAILAKRYPAVNGSLHIPPLRTLLFNQVMEAKDIRRINMQALAIKYESLEKLAELVGSSASTLSQIRNRIRNMGARLARRFEKKLGLGHGWMDSLHTVDDAKPQPVSIYKAPTEELDQILKAYDEMRPELRKQALANMKSMVRTSKEIERHLGTTRRIGFEDENAVSKGGGKIQEHKK